MSNLPELDSGDWDVVDVAKGISKSKVGEGIKGLGLFAVLDGLTFVGVGRVSFFFICGCLDGVTAAEDSRLALKIEEAGLGLPTGFGLALGLDLLSVAFNGVPSGDLIGEQPSKTSSPRCSRV